MCCRLFSIILGLSARAASSNLPLGVSPKISRHMANYPLTSTGKISPLRTPVSPQVSILVCFVSRGAKAPFPILWTLMRLNSNLIIFRASQITPKMCIFDEELAPVLLLVKGRLGKRLKVCAMAPDGLAFHSGCPLTNC